MSAKEITTETTFTVKTSSTVLDAVWRETDKWEFTSEKQFERLTRPGSKYFNLNPFEVLLLPPTATLDEVKRQFRRLSLLVHPDKNANNVEIAQKCFDVVNSAYKNLQDEKVLSFCARVVEEARRRVNEEKEKKNQKYEPTSHADEREVKMMTCKLFADLEQRKQKLEDRDAQERKRKREAEIEMEEQRAADKEFQKKWEEQREERVSSWRSFVGGKGKGKRKVSGTFKPPKVTPETAPASAPKPAAPK